MKLFDAHCHLQDKRVIDKASQLISAALAVGVTNFAVNGTSEVFSQIFLIIWSLLHTCIHNFYLFCLWCQKDWDLVKEMGETYPSVVPCFGLHPWYEFYMQMISNWCKKFQIKAYSLFLCFWFAGLLLIEALIGLTHWWSSLRPLLLLLLEKLVSLSLVTSKLKSLSLILSEL